MVNTVKSNPAGSADRLRELGTAPVGRLLLKYSLPAVVGTVVSAVYNIIDSIVIGHAIDDPNVVSGIAVTFPVMNIVGALGMLIGAGAAARVSIVMGQNDRRVAEIILGNCIQLTVILAPLFLFGFGWGIRGAAIATDISMAVTAVWVMSHFFRKSSTLHFVRGTFRFNWPVIRGVLYIGMAPFLINVTGSAVNAIVNNSLLGYGGDNAVAAVVVFNRFVTIFVFVIIGICQGMQPIVGYNYGSGRYGRLFRTFAMAACAGVVVSTIGSLTGHFNARQIAMMFMQDEAQIECAVRCLRITTLTFWMVGFQIVTTNFFQSLGMAGKSVFLSLTRQIIFMIPLLLILPPVYGLDGVWSAYPISDLVSTLVAIGMLVFQVRHIRREAVRHKGESQRQIEHDL